MNMAAVWEGYPGQQLTDFRVELEAHIAPACRVCHFPESFLNTLIGQLYKQSDVAERAALMEQRR
jgi:hypothetical protein